jgi:hypothetical protein
VSEFFITNSNAAASPVVTALANGNFAVAWQVTVGGNIGLVYRIYDASGAAISDEFSVETTMTGIQSSVSLVALPDGGFLAAWQSPDATGADTSGTSIRARVFSADGTAKGDDYLVNTTYEGNQNTPTGTVLADGRILLTWNSADGEGGDINIRAILLNADGTPAGDDFVVNTILQDTQLTPTVTALADGGYVIAWTSSDTLGTDKSSGLIRATQFDAGGNVVGTADFEVNTTTDGIQANAKVAALPDGGYVITFRSGGEIYARIFEADGTATGDDFIVNNTTAGNQITPAITALDDGRIFMVWSSAESPTVIRGRLFEGDGTPVADDFVINTTQGTTAALPTVSQLEDGSLVVTWRTTLDGVTTIMGTTIELSSLESNAAPTDLALSASEIAENSALGTVIGQFSAFDPDGDALFYTLIDNANGKFSLLTENGITRLIVAGALDYEIATSHTITVKVSDGRGGETTQTFAISVIDVDEEVPEVPVDPNDHHRRIDGDRRHRFRCFHTRRLPRRHVRRRLSGIRQFHCLDGLRDADGLWLDRRIEICAGARRTAILLRYPHGDRRDRDDRIWHARLRHL